MRLHAIDRAPDERLNWKTSIPFFLVHAACLLVLVTGVTWTAVWLGLAMFWGRMFFITAGYHRYFAHRSYRLGRGMQFVMAFGGGMAAQKGALWWAGHHRNHHRYSDTEQDLHSPQKGFWWSHVGWILCDKNNEYDEDGIKDFAKFPELRFLQKHDWIPPWVAAMVCLLVGGWSGLVVGFVISTVLLWHATFTVNSLAHVMGRRRYATTDTSRNSALIALITLGEGWHNNHHYYQASARQGFFWWEYDISYYILKGLSFVGLVHDLKTPPERVLAGARVRDGQFDVGLFRAHWGKATQALLRSHDRGHADGELEAERQTRREQLEELIRVNRAALNEHVQSSLRHAEELAKLSRRQQRAVSAAD
jgi:stearoyl-CoA desaturase (Delta-9 desaturase)